MADDQDDFEKKLAKEQAAGFKDRMENSPPIGGTRQQGRDLQVAHGHSGPQARNRQALRTFCVRVLITFDLPTQRTLAHRRQLN